MSDAAKVQPVLLAPNVLEGIVERLEELQERLVDAIGASEAHPYTFEIPAELEELREITGTVRSWLGR